jgi:TRAP-type C4-dicarboxylate transport system permease small subunit
MKDSDKLDSFRKILHKVVMVITWIGGFSLILLVLVIFINVIGRYVFRSPLPGAVEVSQLLLVVTVFFAITYTEVRKQHVTFDEVVNRFPNRLRAVILGIMYFFVALYAFTLSWQEGLLAISYCVPRIRVTDVLKIPIAPVMFIISIGALLWGVELLVNSFSPFSSSEKEDIIKQEGIELKNKN